MGNSQSAPPPATGADACPVDHRSREAWLDQARKQQEAQKVKSQSQSQAQQQQPTQYPSASYTTSKGNSGSFQASPETASSITSQLNSVLSTNREISTIPRGPTSPDVEGHSSPMFNNEQKGLAKESEDQKKSGNWIYPSPRMFLDALKRKNMPAEPENMEHIVPIHNAVNERVWHEIKQWEAGWGTSTCAGPFSSNQPYLESFHGMGDQNPSPKARINSLLGYQKPFDRHEWVINRCGRKVEYLIDFYAGKNEGVSGKSLNFYLDVRPKLNTWEGWAMRGAKVVGLKFESPKPDPNQKPTY